MPVSFSRYFSKTSLKLDVLTFSQGPRQDLQRGFNRINTVLRPLSQ
jgi:hypothetical protein